MQPNSIPLRVLWLAAALALAGAAVPAAPQGEPDGSGGASARVPAPRDWRDAPDYVELFAPAAYRSTYRAYVSPEPLEPALARLAAEPTLLHPPGAWQPRRTGPAEAFGGSGSYSRWRVARLYVATPVVMALGPRAENGRVVETWTLVSPYPDLSLARLEPGTLLMVARLDGTTEP